MAGVGDFILKQWETWPVQLLVWGTVLLILVVVSAYGLRRLRDSTVHDDVDPANLLTNFREMKLQGDISDKEFRTINALLNEKQAPQLNQNQDAT